MSEKKRRVYKRQGVVHVCCAGKLYAPKSKTRYAPGDEVFMRRVPGCIEVFSERRGSRLIGSEKWHETDIGGRATARTNEPVKTGFLVTLPPGFRESKLGIHQVDTIGAASILVLEAVTKYEISDDEWRLGGWGTVHDPRSLMAIGKLGRDGTIQRN